MIDIKSYLYDVNPYQAFRDKFDEEEIFQVLYGDIIEFGVRTNSPLREDNTPSWIISSKYGLVTYKDFAKKDSGDLYTFIMKYEELPNKFSALGYIEKALKDPPKRDKNKVYKDPDPVVLKVKYRNWNQDDKDFWAQWPISRITLEEYYVNPISHVWVEDYMFEADRLAYVFHEFKDQQMSFEIYQPESINHKWMGNHTMDVWQGWDQCMKKPRSRLVITKSRKDTMFLKEHTDYSSMGLQCETIVPKKHIMEYLRDLFNGEVYLLFDGDLQGILGAQEIIRCYPWVKNMEIPISEQKDITDISRDKGVDYSLKLLDEIMEKANDKYRRRAE